MSEVEREHRIRTKDDLADLVEQWGFLPLL